MCKSTARYGKVLLYPDLQASLSDDKIPLLACCLFSVETPLHTGTQVVDPGDATEVLSMAELSALCRSATDPAGGYLRG